MALTDQLIAYYQFEEASGTRNDSHGSNHLTDNNTVGVTTGVVGNAADFVAANSEHFTRALPSPLDGLSALSVAFWAQARSLSALLSVFGHGDGTSSTFFEGDRVFIRGTLGNQDNTFANPFSTSQFDFYVLRRTPTSVSLRKNDSTSVFSNSFSDSGTISAAAVEPFRLGGQASGSGGAVAYWDGALDQFGLWSRSITSGEETQLYNGGAGLSYAAFGGGGGGGGVKPAYYFHRMRR